MQSSLDKLVTKLGGVDILPQEYGGRKSLVDMTKEWAAELQERRSSLLGKEDAPYDNFFNLLCPSDLDAMTVTENYAVTKTKERKSSLWSLFSGYGASED